MDADFGCGDAERLTTRERWLRSDHAVALSIALRAACGVRSGERLEDEIWGIAELMVPRQWSADPATDPQAAAERAYDRWEQISRFRQRRKHRDR